MTPTTKQLLAKADEVAAQKPVELTVAGVVYGKIPLYRDNNASLIAAMSAELRSKDAEIEKARAEGRADALNEVLRGLNSEDDSLQLRAIAVAVAALISPTEKTK